MADRAIHRYCQSERPPPKRVAKSGGDTNATYVQHSKSSAPLTSVQNGTASWPGTHSSPKSPEARSYKDGTITSPGHDDTRSARTADGADSRVSNMAISEPKPNDINPEPHDSNSNQRIRLPSRSLSESSYAEQLSAPTQIVVFSDRQSEHIHVAFEVSNDRLSDGILVTELTAEERRQDLAQIGLLGFESQLMNDMLRCLGDDLDRLAEQHKKTAIRSMVLWLSVPPSYADALADGGIWSQNKHRAHSLVNTWLLGMLVNSRTQSLIFGTRLFKYLFESHVDGKNLHILDVTMAVEKAWYEEVLNDPDPYSFQHPGWIPVDEPATAPSLVQEPRFQNLYPQPRHKEKTEETYEAGCIVNAIVYKPYHSNMSVLSGTEKEHYSHDRHAVEPQERPFVILKSNPDGFVGIPIERHRPQQPVEVDEPPKYPEFAPSCMVEEKQSMPASSTRKPTLDFFIVAELTADSGHLYGQCLQVTKPSTMNWPVVSRKLGRLKEPDTLCILVEWLKLGLEMQDNEQRAIIHLVQSTQHSCLQHPPAEQKRKAPLLNIAWGLVD